MNGNITHNQSIQLNGSTYHKDEIEHLITDFENNEIPKWEIEMIKFIQLWFSNSSDIEVNTSGSTGLPKTIKYSKYKMISSAIATGNHFNLKPNFSALICLPTQYIAGKMMIVRSIILGLKLFTQKPSVCPIIERKYSFVAMTPMQVQNILSNNADSLKLIEHLIIGGGHINHLLDDKLKSLKKPKSYETYGMTETISHVAIRKINGPDRQTSFYALDGVSFKKDDRRRLIISAVHLDIENLITNDIVILKSSTEFEWIGRYDNIVNSGGLKIHPEIIENKLRKLLKKLFFIAGIQDEKLGEKLVLFIEEKLQTNKIQEKTLMKKIREIIPTNRCPKKIISLPIFLFTNTGKIKRKATMKKYGY